jgi:hypothetical protein
MDKSLPAGRARFHRAVELSAMAAALMAAFGTGAWISLRQDSSGGVPSGANAPYSIDSLKRLLTAETPKRKLLPPAEAKAAEERARSIRHDTDALLAECQRSAAGDWEKWQRDTASYRTALKARLDALKDRPDLKSPVTECEYEALEGRNGFPLFEVGSRWHLNYLYDPATLDKFRADRAVVAAQRWLRQRGIDLIFVPVPKMTEVYVDHFLDPCPPDGIIAPNVRRTLLELLEEDVEVVDALTLFRTMRDADSEFLYNSCDPHWAPRAMRIMAKEVARRIERYQFGTQARFALPIVRTLPGRYLFRDIFENFRGYGLHLLYPEQAKRALRAQTTIKAEVRMQDGSTPPDDPTSPVLLIGHSYVRDFREQLIKELNLLIGTRSHDNQTTEAFADFLREPEILSHCRVVVWLTSEQHMTRFKPLPQAIADILNTATSQPDAVRPPGPHSSP